ncbi:MAG TPA: hypothetical protein VG324_19130 [Blastocatellia bacterium]|nr:hypothetical protein [Blastocatellia bacterium]
MAIQEAIRLRSKRVFAMLAAAAIGLILIAHGCSERKDGAATKVETPGDAGAGAESQSAEFSLSAKDDEGFDLPEREEIRQKRKLAPETKVFVIGYKDAKVDSDGNAVIVMGINGPVKVEAADTDIAEVLVVRSARKREDLQSQKVEISDNKGLYIQVGSAEAPAPVHEFRKRLERVGKRLPETAPSPEPAPEIRRRVVLRLPRGAGLKISEICGDVVIDGVDRHLGIRNVIGNVRATRVAGQIIVGDVNGAVDIALAPGAAGGINIARVNGDVDLRFNGEVNADLRSWDIAGAIKPDFPNAEISNTEPLWGGLKARIGAGGSVIEIHYVSGNVTLSKAGIATASALKAAAK